MKISLITLVLLLIAGCSSTPTIPVENDNNPRKRVETAIAREILEEIRQDLPQLKGSIRSTYLHQKTTQFRRSVDLGALKSATRQEYTLLEYLNSAEQVRWHGENYESRIRAMSSLSVNLLDLEALLLNELTRIDQTLAVLIEDPALDVLSHMRATRDAAIYPDDSFEGRQGYLDALEVEMQSSFKRWQHLLAGVGRGIELRGEELGGPTFYYKDGTLSIDLSDVGTLPDFELASIAAFYGYPGRSALSPAGTSRSLRSLLQLPGYSMGWAWYILDKDAERYVDQPQLHLYFSKLMTSLALADLRLHTNAWSNDEATNTIFSQTPYSMNRIGNMLATVQSRPGYYLSAFAGKGKLTELQSRCVSACESTLLQRLITLGPLPFDLLEEHLVAERLIQ